MIYQKEHKNEVDESNPSEENQIKYNDFNFGDECIKDIGVETYSLFEDEEIDINKKTIVEDTPTKILQEKLECIKQAIVDNEVTETKRSESNNMAIIETAMPSSIDGVSNDKASIADTRNHIKAINENIYSFGDLGYITKTEYLALLAEGQRKATGKQKNFFNNKMIKVGSMVYNTKYGVGVIDTVDKAEKYVKVIFCENNKQEIFIRPTCFIQEKLILLKGHLHSML